MLKKRTLFVSLCLLTAVATSFLPIAVVQLPCAAEQDSDEEQAHDTEINGQTFVEFTVALTDNVDGSLIAPGYRVECTLKDDLQVRYRTIAPAGSKVFAHVELPTRNAYKSERKSMLFRLHHPLVLKFDRIVTPGKQQINIDGLPLKQSNLFNNNGTFRLIQVGTHGQFVKAQDVDLYQLPEAGISLDKQLVEPRTIFHINLKEGDEIKVMAALEPDRNISGKILNTVP